MCCYYFNILYTFQELGLYYDGNSGTYYYYDHKCKAFQFHSQVEASHSTVPSSTCGVTCTGGVKLEEPESKRGNKHRDTKVSNTVLIFTFLAFLPYGINISVCLSFCVYVCPLIIISDPVDEFL
jgi:hypothetical protein